MDNDTIFSGTSAHPAREIVEALHGRHWDLDADMWRNSFAELVGAVTTLALTVDEQRTELARLNASLTAVARVVERDAPTRGGLPLTAAEQIKLVYAGLAEVWTIAHEGLTTGGRNNSRAVLNAIEARLRAMLEAAGKLPPN